jgi:hypothetical protein
VISETDYEPVRLAKQEVAKLEEQLAKLKKEKPQPKEEIDQITAEIAKLKNNTPLYNTPMANALSEESLYVVRAGEKPQDGTRLEYRPGPRDLPAFVRGNPNRPGPIVPRRFLSVLSEQARPYTNGSGRLELADSITSEATSLTARVLVNRIWLAHFGRGMVATPSNFGRQGSRPTHPKLLDDLAARFVRNGWSLKQLHREILLSATWRQASDATPESIEADPENLWLSRMNARRLTFEQWRDAMLHCSGALRHEIGGPSIGLEEASNVRRTLYATVHRRDMSPTLMIHDFPDPTQHSPARNTTVTALQGLYALNGPLLLQQSERLIQRVNAEASGGIADQIRRLYWLLYCRPPSKQEINLGEEFLGGGDQPIATERWQQYAHVLLASNELMFVD